MKEKTYLMLQTFKEVLKGNDEYILRVIPDSYQNNIFKIDYNNLKERGIKNIIFDIDNTLLIVNSMNVPNEVIEFINRLKQDFNIIIVSNNDEHRVKPISDILNVNYLANAHKPCKGCFDKSLEILDGNLDNTVMIGDQMLTDIKGAHDYGLYTILVDPISNIYDLKTGCQRVLQNIMIKSLKKNNKFCDKTYY